MAFFIIREINGGLGHSCPVIEAQSLLSKYVLRQLAAGGSPALHFSYWMGAALQVYMFPFHQMQLSSLGTGQPPVQFVVLHDLLLTVVALPSVTPDFLHGTITKSSLIYKDLLTDLPPPRIQLKLPALPLGPFLVVASFPPLLVTCISVSCPMTCCLPGRGNTASCSWPRPLPASTVLP